MDVGSSEVHQVEKKKKGCSHQRKKKHHLHVFNCPVMLYVVSTNCKMPAVFYPIF